MKRNIILFPIKQQISKVVLNKLSNKNLRRFYRYSIVLNPVSTDSFDVDLQFSSCSPFDRFTRKIGYDIAITKPKFRLKGIEDKAHLEEIINELVYLASSFDYDFEKVILGSVNSQEDGIAVIQIPERAKG